MKRFLLPVAIAVFFAGWQTVCLFAQDARKGEDVRPPEEEPVPFDIDRAPRPVAEKPAPPAASVIVVEQPADSAPLSFDVDRAPRPISGRPSSSQPEPGVEPPAPPAIEPRGSFWGRLFGISGKRRPPPEPPWWSWAPARRIEPGSRAPVADLPELSPPARVAAPKSEAELLAAREEVRRQAEEIEALRKIDLACQDMGRNEYVGAIRLFNEALELMPMRPHTLETRNMVHRKQAECQYNMAMRFFQEDKRAEARRHALLALERAPNHQPTLDLIKQLDAPAPPIIERADLPIKQDPEIISKQGKIRAAIERGRQYYKLGEYEKAAREFRLALLQDDGNEDANAWLKKVAETEFNRESWQYERLKKEMMTQVRDAWTHPVKEDIVPPPKRSEKADLIHPEKQLTIEKLNTIRISELDFRDANIVDVITFLDRQAIVADKASPAGKRGINILLNLRRRDQAPEAPAAEAEGAEAPGAVEAAAAKIPKITLKMRDIVLLDAIKYITEVTGLKYRIEPNVVLITPADEVVGDVITRTYRVVPNLGELIRSRGQPAAAPAPGAPAGPFPAVAPVAGAAGPGDVRAYFMDMGVNFPRGTSIKYQPSLNLLIVANTIEELDKLEIVLKQINEIPPQIEIEARFVEVGQTDLEELGFEWLLTDNWEIAQDVSPDAPLPLSARRRIQVNKTSFSQGQRHMADLSGATSPGGGMGAILSVSSILTNPELSFLLHALEMREGANLLSAPKVTTKSGNNAEIKIVRELVYPTDFESQAQTVGGAEVGATTVVTTPGGFATRDTGVILNVTPQVGPDGFTIDLMLSPQVVELADWVNYGQWIAGADGVLRQQNMPQPIFLSRSITTQISIWDGQTVVMGGLITEQQSTTEDKIPFLGDVPLLGFFFRSKTNKSVKHNLLIFVTACLVDPAGNRVNPMGVDMSAPIKTVAGNAGEAVAVAP